jgi:4-amino-4-deoxy-L-arabinose transferase-like glycosyltransferase
MLLAVSGRYGLHRDELYFVVAGRNLDWGFVDQPPLTPLVARVAELVGGTSAVSLRVLPALAIGAVGVMAAVMARRFGGGLRAQTFAAFGAAWAGVALGVGHLLSTATFEYLLWSGAILIVVGILDDADPRWWVALGVTIGVGLQNKHLIATLAAAILAGLLLTYQRRRLRSPWPWIGAAVAAVIALPNVLWQAANDWPQLEMAKALARRSDGPVAFVLQQPLLLSIALAIPAGVGVGRLLRSPQLARWRPIGFSFLLLFGVFLLTRGKAYYLAPMYPVLLAAGGGWFEGLSLPRRRLMAGAAGAGVAVGMFIALPLLPVTAASTLDATGELGETVGWPELIDQVAEVYASIPEPSRATVAVFTGSYGEAGAIDVLGPRRGLPAAVSGHNNYWLWGPPERHGPVIGVGAVEPSLRMVCPGLQRVGTIGNPYGVDNEEAGLPLYLCLEPQRQLADVWEAVRHYN